jgi:hypothetical protein
MAFDYNTLIFDRTSQEEYDNLELAKKGWDDFTDDEKRKWLNRGIRTAYNYWDLNRIGEAIRDVSVVIETQLGIRVAVNPKSDWARGDKVIRGSGIENLLIYVRRLGEAVSLEGFPELPGDIYNINYEGMNAIERTLYMLNDAISSMITPVWYMGPATTTYAKATTMRAGRMPIYLVPKEAPKLGIIHFEMTDDSTDAYLSKEGYSENIVWKLPPDMPWIVGEKLTASDLPVLPKLPDDPELMGIYVEGWLQMEEMGGYEAVTEDGIEVDERGVTLYARCRFSRIVFDWSSTTNFTRTQYTVALPDPVFWNINEMVTGKLLPPVPANPVKGPDYGEPLAGWNTAQDMSGPNYNEGSNNRITVRENMRFYVELIVNHLTFEWVPGTNAEDVAGIALPSVRNITHGSRIYSWMLPELPTGAGGMVIGYFLTTAGTIIVGNNGLLVTGDETLYLRFVKGSAIGGASDVTKVMNLVSGGLRVYARGMSGQLDIDIKSISYAMTDNSYMVLALPRDQAWTDITLEEAAIYPIDQLTNTYWATRVEPHWYLDQTGGAEITFPMNLVGIDKVTLYLQTTEIPMIYFKTAWTTDSSPLPDDTDDEKYPVIEALCFEGGTIVTPDMLNSPFTWDNVSTVYFESWFTDPEGENPVPQEGIEVSDNVTLYARYKILGGSKWNVTGLEVEVGTYIWSVCTTELTVNDIPERLLGGLKADSPALGIYFPVMAGTVDATYMESIKYTEIGYPATGEDVSTLRVIEGPNRELYAVVVGSKTINLFLGRLGNVIKKISRIRNEQLVIEEKSVPIIQWKGEGLTLTGGGNELVLLNQFKRIDDRYIILYNNGEDGRGCNLAFKLSGQTQLQSWHLASDFSYLMDIGRIPSSYFIVSATKQEGNTGYSIGYGYCRGFTNSGELALSEWPDKIRLSARPLAMPVLCTTDYTYIGVEDNIRYCYNSNIFLGDSWEIGIQLNSKIAINRMEFTGSCRVITVGINKADKTPVLIYSSSRPGNEDIRFGELQIADTVMQPVDMIIYTVEGKTKIEVYMQNRSSMVNIFTIDESDLPEIQ